MLDFEQFEQRLAALRQQAESQGVDAGAPADTAAQAGTTDKAILAQIIESLEAAADELRQRYAELALRRQGSSGQETRAQAALVEQSQRLQILHQIDRSILAAQAPDEIATAAVRGVRQATGAARVTVMVFRREADAVDVLGADGLVNPEASAGMRVPLENRQWYAPVCRGEICIVDDLAALADLSLSSRTAVAQGVGSYTAIPLMVGESSIGALLIERFGTGRLVGETLELGRHVADSLSVAIHNARLNDEVRNSRQQLRGLSRRLVALQEQQQKSLSRELHDRSGQSMTALKLGLGLLKREEEGSPARLARVDELLQMADRATQELHDLAVSLRPSALDRYGLIPALELLLESFRKQNAAEVEFLASGLDQERLAEDVETALYRIIQEGLTNISRHAEATRVAIIISRRAGAVSLILEDNGRGFDVAEALQRGRLGLLGMRERAEMLGGSLVVESAPGAGATVYIALPTDPQAELEEVSVEFGQAPPSGGARKGGAGGVPAAEADGVLPEAELARAKALSDVLVGITGALAGALTVEEILGQALSQSAQAVDCETAAVLQREGPDWIVRYGYRLPADAIGRHFLDQETMAGVLAEQTRQAVVIDDTSKSDLPGARLIAQYGIRSVATVPLLAHGEVQGVLSLMHNAAPVPFKPSEIEFLNRLGAAVSLALENARLRVLEAQQRAELARRVEELQVVLDLIPVGIAIADDTHARTITANPANARMLGLPPHSNASLGPTPEQGGANYRVYRGGRELEVDELPMQIAAAKGLAVRDMLLDVVRADGERLTLLSNVAPLFDAQGKTRGAVGAFVDITELRNAEAERERLLRELQAKTEELEVHDEELRVQNEDLMAAVRARELALAERDLILNSIADGLVVYDREGKIVRMNAIAEEMLGVDPQTRALPIAERAAAVGLARRTDGSPLPPAEYPAARALQGEVVRNQELILRVPARADGALRVSVSSAPICAPDGSVAGCVTTFRDIQDVHALGERLERANRRLRRLTRDLREAAARLEGRVEERTADLAQANAALAESEAELRYQLMLLSRISDAVVAVGADRRIRYWNRAAEQLFGWTAADVLGRPVSEVLQPENSEPERDRTYRDVEAQDQWRGERVLRHRQGARLHVDVTGMTLRDESGGVTGYVGVYRDMTEGMQAEEALAVQAERLAYQANLLDGVSDAIMACDTEQRITVWNHAAEEQYGWKAAEAMGGNIFSVTGSRMSAEEREEMLRVVQETGYWRGEVEHARRDSTPIMTEGTTILLRDALGRTVGYASVYQDVTLAKQAEAQIAYQARLLANVHDAVIATDEHFIITAWNRAAEDLYGWQAAEVIGRPVGDVVRSQLVGVTAEDAARVLVDTGIWLGEFVQSRRDGSRFPGEATTTALKDSRGRITGYVSVNRETSERARTEDELRRHAARAEALASTAQRLNARLNLHTALSTVCAETAHALDAEAIWVNLFDEQSEVLRFEAGFGLPQEFAQRYLPPPRSLFDQYSGRPGPLIVNPDVRTLPAFPNQVLYAALDMRSVVSATMQHEGELIGVLSIATIGQTRQFSDDELLLLEGLANQAAIAIANARLHEQVQANRTQLQALVRRRAEVQERERAYVADQLLNETSQVLAAFSIQVGMLERDLESGRASPAQLATMKEMAGQVLVDLHHLATHLRPAVLDRLGLAAALGQYLAEYGREHGLAATFAAGNLGGIRLIAAVETAVYRIVQEALANVAQHAQASAVEVDVRLGEDRLILTVEDDGVGFSPSEAMRRGALGLLGMSERAEAVGGRLALRSAAGSGTTVRLEVPLTTPPDGSTPPELSDPTDPIDRAA